MTSGPVVVTWATSWLVCGREHKQLTFTAPAKYIIQKSINWFSNCYENSQAHFAFTSPLFLLFYFFLLFYTSHNIVSRSQMVSASQFSHVSPVNTMNTYITLHLPLLLYSDTAFYVNCELWWLTCVCVCVCLVGLSQLCSLLHDYDGCWTIPYYLLDTIKLWNKRYRLSKAHSF